MKHNTSQPLATPLHETVFTVHLKGNRQELMEGRSTGLGFAFCRRTGDVLTTVQPLSPCKDYLNDVVYTEMTGIPVRAYGLQTEKQDIFADGFGYLLMQICPHKNGEPYHTQEKETVALRLHYPQVTALLNHYEEQLGLQERTTIEVVGPDLYLLTVPGWWCSQPYLISLYTLLVRVAQFYRGAETPDLFLKTFQAEPSDSYLLGGVLPKLQKLLVGVRPVQDFTGKRGTRIHDYGIASFNF